MSGVQFNNNTRAVITDHDSAAEHTILDIAGAGRLHGVTVSDFNNVKTTVAITVIADGVETTIAVKGGSTNNTGYKHIYLGHPYLLQNYGSNGYLTLAGLRITPVTNTGIYDFDFLLPFQNGAVESFTSYSGSAGCFIDYLDFKESLVIKVRVRGTDNRSVVLYSLDE